jgi:PKD repeat protein
VVVQILVTPSEADFGNATTRFVNIRVVPTGTLGPGTSPFTPNFTAPSATVGNPATFTGTISGTDAAAQVIGAVWDFGDGTTSGGLITSHTFNKIGTYLVTLAIVDSLGRTNSVTRSVTVTQGTLPVASFIASPTSVGVNQQVNFNASGSSVEPGHTIVDYAWVFGDGEFGGGEFATHSYHNAGTYTVTLRVTDDAGRKSTNVSSATISVGTAAPSASFTFSPSSPTTGQTVNFNASASTATSGRTITSYAWNFDDGSTGSGVTTSHPFSASGSYSVTLTVTDSAGQTASTSRTVSVTDPAKPTADFNFSPTSPTVGQTVNFNGTLSTAPSGRTITAYAWNFGDGGTATGPQPTHVYAVSGSYSVTLTVTDSAGQTSAPRSQNITVGTLQPPTASFTFSPTNPIIGQVVSFDGSASNAPGGRTILTYTWNFGDGSPAGSGVSTTHTYTTAGTFSATLTVRDSGGQSNTSSPQTITVSGPTTARITVSPDPSSGPAGSSVNVFFDGTASTPANGRSIVSYSWTFQAASGAAPSNSSAVSRSFTAPPATTSVTYTVTLTVTDNLGGTDTKTVSFTINGT